MRYNLADLHTHSFCSDGMRTPTQAVEEARDAGLQALSLTDHDTVEGIDEAIEAGKRLGGAVIAGRALRGGVVPVAAVLPRGWIPRCPKSATSMPGRWSIAASSACAAQAEPAFPRSWRRAVST